MIGAPGITREVCLQEFASLSTALKILPPLSSMKLAYEASLKGRINLNVWLSEQVTRERSLQV